MTILRSSFIYFVWIAASVVILIVYLLTTRLGVFPIAIGPLPTFQAPLLSESLLETVVRLPIPPGNVAVSDKGRVFFTFHPEYHQDPAYPFNVGEVKGPTSFAAFPPINFQRSSLKSVLSLRIDHLDRLWLLDFAWHGTAGKGPQLVCFQLLDRGLTSQSEAVLAEQEATPTLHYVFPSHVAGLGSFLNDFVVDRDGRTVYIADTSLLAQTPALIVFRSDCNCAFRLLHAHPQFFGQSAHFPAAGYVVGGFAGGLVGFKVHLDSIALVYGDSAAQVTTLRKRAKALLHQAQMQLLRPRASSAAAVDTALDSGFESLVAGHAGYSERRLVLGALTGTEMLTIRDVNAIARLCRQSNVSTFARHPQDATRSVDPHRHPQYAALHRQLDAALRQNLRRASATKPVTDGLTALSGGGAVVLTDVSQSALTVATLNADDGVVTGYVTLVRSPRLLQWPDGLSQAADGSLYITASRLQRRFGRATNASSDGATAGGAILRLAARHVVGAMLSTTAGNAKVVWAAPVSAGQ